MGESNGSGWIGALDPAENLRAMTDARGEGRRIAEEFADQLLSAAGLAGTARSRDAPSASGGIDEVLRELRADAAHVGDASANLVEHAFALLSSLAKRFTGGEGVAGGGAAGPGGTALVVGPVPAGEEGTGVFWVHNSAPEVVPSVRPHCAPPRSHCGAELSASAIRFDPEVLDPLPARSSCGIEVRIRIPAGTAPGRYASVIMASNAPDWYLPISVMVTGPGGAE